MIKPTTLWGLFKSCTDSTWLGDICRSLGGQLVDLDFGQTQMVNAVKMDSGWMDERIEAQRERWRARQREKRVRDIGDNGDMSHVTQCHGDNCVSNDVTSHPSIPPSIPPVPKGTIKEREKEREIPPSQSGVSIPSDEEQRVYARQIGVPEWFLAEFMEAMRGRGYSYVNRGGSTVVLNKRNFKAVLGSFWQQRRKDGVQQGDGSANVAGVETELGRQTGDALIEMLRRGREEVAE